jgi:putative heme-binding domain-containing protein
LPSSSVGLLGEISSTNRWRRDTAFRLLRERSSDTNLPAQTRQALNACRTPVTAARLLQLLEHLGALDPDAILGGFAAPMPELRELALRLSEPFIAREPAIAHAAAAMATDGSPRVRFQNALVMGTLAVDSPQVAIPVLAEIARRDGADPWTRTAVLSSIHLQERHFLNALLATPASTADPVLPVLEELGGMLGRMLPSEAHGDVVRLVLDPAFRDPSRALVLLGAFAEASGSIPTPFPTLAEKAGARPEWDRMSEVAMGALQRDDTLPSLRIAAARLGGTLPTETLSKELPRILRSPGPTALLAAAARLGAAPPLADITPGVLAPGVWHLLPAPNRAVILTALLARSAHLPHVIEALAAGTLKRHELTAGQRTQLLRVSDPLLRSNAVALLQPPPAQSRQSALQDAKPALSLTGHANLGRALFRDRCAPCHRLEGEGNAVGPDLFDVRNQSRETLLLHILIPSQEIAPPFVQYRAETRSGRIVSGLLASDTAAGITLRLAHGLLEKITRDDLVRLEPMAESFMPDGLENGWNHQDLADLLAFLKGTAP